MMRGSLVEKLTFPILSDHFFELEFRKKYLGEENYQFLMVSFSNKPLKEIKIFSCEILLWFLKNSVMR